MHTESSLGWGGQEMRIMRELVGLSRASFRPLLACQPESQLAKKAEAQGIDTELVKMRGNIDPISMINSDDDCAERYQERAGGDQNPM